jgi:hypothetical protein
MANSNLLDLLTESLAAEHDDHDIKSIIPSITRHLLNFTIPKFSRIVVFGGSYATVHPNQDVLYYDYIENTWSVDPVNLTTDNVFAAKCAFPPMDDGSVFVVGNGPNGDSQDIYRVSPAMITQEKGLNPCFQKIETRRFPNTGRFYQFEGGVSIMISMIGELNILANNGRMLYHRFSGRLMSTCIVVQKTKLLIMGGVHIKRGLKNCLLFDSTTLTITLVAPMNRPRYGHSACILPNGNVFICGGAIHRSSCEEYDVERNVWMLRNVKVDMLMHACVSLDDGRVFIVGGGSKSLFYDSIKKKVSKGPDMPFPVYNPIIALGEALA